MNFFEQQHASTEDTTMNPRAVLFAIKTLIHQSEIKEIHGNWYDLAEMLLVELMGHVENIDHIREFASWFLQPWTLQEIVQGSNIVFERGNRALGTLSLFDVSVAGPQDE